MAHEVKNPLTAIRTFTEYLPKKKDDPEFLEKFARIVGQEVGRIDDLVHQLLDFAKPDPLAVEPTNINALVSDLLVMLSQKCVKHHIRVDFRPAATTLMTLPVDPAKIHQALLNILLNAIDAMPDGGELRVSTNTTLTKQGPAIEIRVIDTGPGIPPEDQARIFDPFFSKKDNGTGLGLSITQGLIREHAGRITLQSTPVDGTTFIIVLPLSQE